MGRLDNVDSNQLKYYLKNINIKVNCEWVKSVAIADIIILYISIIFCQNKLLYGIVFSLVNVAVITTLVYFIKRVEHSIKYIYLYSGVFTCHTAVCLAVLSNILYCYITGKKSLLVLFVLIIVDIIVALSSNFVQYIKMSKNKYKNFNGRFATGGVFVIGMLISRILQSYDVNFLYVFMICAVVCSMAFAHHSHLFLRYYCCLLLEKRSKK